jgi:integrase
MLEKSTSRVRRRMLDAFCERHGKKPFALMEQKIVRQFRDEKVAAGTPEAANNLVKTLRAVFAWAVEAEEAQHNPAKGVPKINTGSSGFYTWTEKEVFQFMDYHPIGTKARKALSIMLLTGVRPSDAIRLGPQHERPGDTDASNGLLSFTEYKNRKRKPKHRTIPILPELRQVLDATPSGHLTYLVTEFGKPYASAKAFGNWFKRQCVMAGLPMCTAHGLRKAGATIAAQNGIPAHALMAIYGWSTLKQAETYTHAVNEQKLAEAHMHSNVPERKVGRSVPLLPAVTTGGTFRSKKA